MIGSQFQMEYAAITHLHRPKEATLGAQRDDVDHGIILGGTNEW